MELNDGYKPEYSEQVRRLFAIRPVSDTDLSDIYGVSITTIEAWKRNYSDFAEAISHGLNTAPKPKYRTPKKGKPETIKRYAQSYYQKHKEQFKIRAIARYHAQKNLAFDLTEQDWIEALKYFDNRCAYCGQTGDLQKEHVIPVARGGGFTRKNIVPACAACNESKGSKLLHDWYKYTTVYSDERLLKLIGWIYGEQARAEIEVQCRCA